MKNNLCFEIKENTDYESNKKDINQVLKDENFFSMQNEDFFTDSSILAQQINYDENYTVKMLQIIANYYSIPRVSRYKKEDLINIIIEFENDDANVEKVSNLKKYWNYLLELKSDSFFSKFVIFNT